MSWNNWCCNQFSYLNFSGYNDENRIFAFQVILSIVYEKKNAVYYLQVSLLVTDILSL